MSELPNLASPRELMLLLERYGLKPQHGLGQNFLIDGNTIRKIVAAAVLEPGEGVVEIGPGAGAITLAMARLQARLLAIELDRGLAGMLSDLLRPFPLVTVLQADALSIDWPALLKRSFPPGRPVKLVSNLPYYISAPLLYKLFQEKFPFDRAVLMFQKEVAQRLTALPGDPSYGNLSVLCQYYTDAAILFKVSRRAFWPSPGVDSVVLAMEPRPRELTAAEELAFWRIVRSVFQQRRKTLLNSLALAFPYPRELAAALLDSAGIKPVRRPETLSVGEFATLSRIIYNYERKNERVAGDDDVPQPQ